MKNPKVFIFDVGSTLFEPYDFNYVSAMKYLYENIICQTVSYEIFVKQIDGIFHIFKDRDINNIEVNFHSLLKYLYTMYGKKSNLDDYEIEKEFAKIFYKTKEIDKVKKLLNYLTSKNIPLYVLSNSMLSSVEIKRELSEFSLDKYFIEIVSSGDHLFRKPSKELFNMYVYKLNNMGYKNLDICYIGDSLHNDIETPISLGLFAVHKNKENMMHEKYLEINDYDYLIEWLENNDR